MAKVPTTLSIDAEVKARVQTLFAELGLDLSTAVNLFFRRCLMENGIPFDVALPRAAAPAPAGVNVPAGVAAAPAGIAPARAAGMPANVTDAPAATEAETIDLAARRILDEHLASFEELAK